MKHFVLVLPMLLLAAVAMAQPDNAAELLADPQYMEEDIKPVFQEVTPQQLIDSVKVVSGRSYAVFGFNAPRVEAHFPAIDNNVYAEIKFSDATLFDESGNEVSYERENGFYTHDDRSSETRFVAPDYGEELIEYARAKGKVTIRYPSVIRTISVKTSDSEAMKKSGIVLDGAFVKVYDHGGIAKESFTSPVEGLRVYDANGRRLKRYDGWGAGGGDDIGSWRGVAYHGAPARFDADIIEEWIGVEFEYDLPPAPLRPKSQAGFAPDKTEEIPATPGGSVTGKEVNIIPPEVLGWYADMSQEDLLERLKQNSYREFNEESMVLAATEGNTEAVQILLAAGVTPNAVARNGRAIINAAWYGRTETTLLLIAAGADVNAVDDSNSSALLRATNSCDNVEIVRALIDAGADVEVQAKGSATPMMMATVMNCAEIQKLLKDAGAKEWKQGQ